MRSRPKSAKRQAFEAACTKLRLDWCYLKAGMALVDDPEAAVDEGGVRPTAIVRLRPYGHGGLAPRDLPAFRRLYEAGVNAYIYSVDVGFVKLSRERLGFSPLVGDLQTNRAPGPQPKTVAGDPPDHQVDRDRYATILKREGR